MPFPAQTVRQAFRCALAASGLHRLFPQNPEYRGVILMLHRVISGQETGFVRHSRRFMVTARGLERSLRHLLSRGYRFLTPDQVVEELGTEPVAPPRPPFALLTFDDGFRDTLTLALPLMRRLGIPFTVYVCSGVPDGRWILWPHVLDRLITARPCLDLEWEGERLRLPTRTASEQDTAYDRLRALIINLPEDGRREFLHRLAQGSGIDPGAACQALSLSWADLRELAADPLVTLGAHTVSHVELASLSPSAARAEMETSRGRLEEELRLPVRHFAYPFGSKPRPEAGGHLLAQTAGFTTAVTTLPGHVVPAHRNHLYQLPRHNLEDRVPPALYETRLKAALDRLQRRPTEVALG